MIDAIRELVCAQSHRRMIDPRFLAKRVQPFEIIRPAAGVVSPHDASQSGPANQAHQVRTDDRAPGDLG